MNGAPYRLRKLILVLLAALLATLTPTASGLVFAFLTPLWFFFAAIVVVQVRIADECFDLPLLPNLPIFSSRPPPTR